MISSMAFPMPRVDPVMSIVLCMAEPQMTGIGGDCFALITNDGTTKNLKAINASGYAGKKYKSSKSCLRIT